MLTVQHISHTYASRKGEPAEALRDISFAMARGEITALVGPNGSGKSTLFNLLCGTLPLQTGAISHEGEAVTDARRGVVFQSPSLDPYLTVAENIRHHAMLYGIDIKRDDLGSVLFSELELEQYFDHRVSTLSGGYQRRVELAKALLTKPDILILDEPFTGLDVSARNALFRILQEVTAQRGLVTLLITHVLSLATDCNRVVVLEQGRTIADDAPDVLLREFGNTIVELQGPVSHDIARRLQVLANIDYVVVQDEHVLLKNTNLQQLLPHLDAGEAETLDIQARRPTLDDYFIERTGHHLLDETEELIAA